MVWNEFRNMNYFDKIGFWGDLHNETKQEVKNRCIGCDIQW